jgi:hypothetical protein
MKKIAICVAASLAGMIIGHKLGKEMSKRPFKKLMRLAAAETQVCAPDYIKEHASDIKHVESNNDNAVYINSEIHSKVNTSKSILSHEIGHHRDNKQNSLVPEAVRELKAWKNGPKDVGENYDEIKKNALRTYIRPVLGSCIGICAGLGIVATMLVLSKDK